MSIKNKYSILEIRKKPLIRISGLFLAVLAVAFLYCRVFYPQWIKGCNFFIWIGLFSVALFINAIFLWRIGNQLSSVLCCASMALLVVLGFVYYFLFIL